ncbi:flagellar M-ring protein FliF [Oceaniovalibus guishaninsula JLT2003]|uniref:Flagellar M-ring protein n=1 Tax=Oceaniovalibus guishaninsula JLT2003 TaxID=1231392 RepID=K2I4F7_9RHOB|nr:flagellar M-ring protein FliF [Oceaniovalibus guishaninsula JLT2003]
MEQIGNVWAELSMRRRIIAGLAALAMFAAVLGVARMASQPGMALLYAGLEDGAAGEVVQALEARGVAYDIRGTSIFVDSAQRDQLRMTMASEGLPSNPTQGYELLDQMTGFGTTSQMFDAAYWRAKEGELARTIVSSPGVQHARVHIANPAGRPFQRNMPSTASVTVTPAAGGLPAAHARALRYLVASAVTGLSPENVSIIDANGGVILGGDDAGSSQGDAADRAAALKSKVERLLEARVGYGRAVVEVNVETVTEREQITERRIDPDSRVAISQDRSEIATTSSDQGSADVTVASNLPDEQGAGGGDKSQSENSETRERTNYEVSEVQREVLRNPGAIDRVTTAVLIDGIFDTGADGAPIWQPRPEEEMEALRELVASAVGFNPERGDSLTLKTMQFEPLPTEGSAPGSALAGAFNIDAMRLAQLGLLGLVAVALGLFVVRPILSAKPAALPAPDEAAPRSPALMGEIDPEDTPQTGLQLIGDAATRARPGEPSAVDRLRALIDERQEESLQILRNWMEDEGEKA